MQIWDKWGKTRLSESNRKRWGSALVALQGQKAIPGDLGSITKYAERW